MRLIGIVAAVLQCLAICTTAHAQWAPADTFYYYTDQLIPCNRDEADWYCKVAKQPNKDGWYAFTQYWPSNKVRKIGYSLSEHGNTPIGLYKEYFSDGISVEKEGHYAVAPWNNKTTVQYGRWIMYWPNGQKLTEREYRMDNSTRTSIGYVVNHWDSLGVQRVTNGNGSYSDTYFNNSFGTRIIETGQVKDGLNDGVWNGYYYNNAKLCYTETYRDGKLIKGISYDKKGKKYRYSQVEAFPEFAGGEAALIKFIGEHIIYPKQDKANNVQGKMLLRFAVATNGDIEDVRVLRSVSPDMDKEGLRVVSQLPKFTPGAHRGQAVRVYYNLPLVFKLQ